MWDMKCYKPAHKSCGHWQNVEKREEGEGLREISNRKAKGQSSADNGREQRKVGWQQQE